MAPSMPFNNSFRELPIIDLDPIWTTKTQLETGDSGLKLPPIMILQLGRKLEDTIFKWAGRLYMFPQPVLFSEAYVASWQDR